MMSDKKIYLDYAATTPVDKRVLDAMLPYFSEHFGNPSSVHTFGQRTEAAIEAAREDVARILGCNIQEIIFTSCGSESDNLALRGTALAMRHQNGSNHILISPTEHHAVSLTAEQLRSHFGFELEYLSVDSFGQVDPEEVEKRLRPDTAVVSIIYANNEIGTVNPISEIGAICRERKVAFHTDAVQAAAYLPVNVNQLNVDMLSLGAHKFYGPKGIGALYVRNGTPILPVQTGGGQEFRLRAGTSNVPYIVGLASALELAEQERDARRNHVQPLRDRIISRVTDSIPDVKLTGHSKDRMPNHASFVFQGVDGNELLMMLDIEGYACSSGSACKTGDPEPSDVLMSLGYPTPWALGSLRISLGTHTTSEEVEAFLDVLPHTIKNNRQLVRAL
jgi:cysteine desulfurase